MGATVNPPEDRLGTLTVCRSACNFGAVADLVQGDLTWNYILAGLEEFADGCIEFSTGLCSRGLNVDQVELIGDTIRVHAHLL